MTIVTSSIEKGIKYGEKVHIMTMLNYMAQAYCHLKMFDKDKAYRYTYKNVEYAINYNHIDYIQREGRKVRIVTTNGNYYQNISINMIKNKLPSYFIQSTKGIIINIKNVSKIDWQKCNVVFKDNIKGYLVSKSHRKEIEGYELV